jgi:hypothetical protein
MDRYLRWFDAARVEDVGRQLLRRLVALCPACRSARKALGQVHCAECRNHRRRRSTRGVRFKRNSTRWRRHTATLRLNARLDADARAEASQ